MRKRLHEKIAQSNGATYAGISGGYVNNYNYLYPQAPINFLAALNLSF